MVSFQPEELYAAGENVSDFSKGLATDVANTVCSLYQAAPKGFLSGTPADGIPAFARGFWDSFCGRLPEPKLPPAPVPPFPGGQCPGVLYRVALSYSIGQSESSGALDVYGPIRGTFAGVVGDFEITRLLHSDSAGNPAQFTLSTAPNDGGAPFANITSVTRLDGQQDNCGSLPADWPNSGNTLPPSNPGQYNFPGNGGSGVPVPYTVDIDPTLIVPIVRIPVDIDNEIEVTFDAGGITVNMPVDLGFGGDKGGVSPEDLNGINDKLSDLPTLKDLLEDLTDTGAQSSSDKGEKENGSEGTEPGITGLVIQVTGYPVGYGRRFGQPQVFDFGRVHFKRGDFYTQSIPLTLIQQWCRADPDSDGYAIFLNPGVKANVTVVKQETE